MVGWREECIGVVGRGGIEGCESVDTLMED
jgi:hypothetical protein